MRSPISSLCLVVAMGLLYGISAYPQRNAASPIFLGSGTWLQSCADWNSVREDFKLGYVVGQIEVRSQFIGALGTIPGTNQVKEMFETPPGITMGDFVKSLDNFCRDTYNARIALVNAFGVVSSRFSGSVLPDDQILPRLRCLGAAGNDPDRVRACYKSQ